MEDLVSVVVLSYKNTAGIYETLDSVMSQTYPNIEIVVSDDGSPAFEEEVEKIRLYVETHEKGNISGLIVNAIKVNGGTVKNINSAIRRSKGKYVKVLSAEDTFVTEDALETYVSFMKQHEYRIIFAKMRGRTPDGEYKYELLSCESDYDLLKSYNVEDTKNRLFRRNFLPAPAWMIDRELFEEHGLFPEDTRLIEDYPYWITLTLKGEKFGYLDKVLIEYKLSGVSSAGNYSEMFMKDMLVIYDKYIFPYDRRFGPLQQLYNGLKRAGLNFYMAETRRKNMTPGQRIWARIKYLPFYVFVKLQDFIIMMKNKKHKE